MTNEQKLREIEEGTPEIKRSELWNKIYSIVRQIPRENVNCDAMDASSASSEIERMVTALISEGYVSKDAYVALENTLAKAEAKNLELLQQRDELREALIDMVWQFAYRGTYEGRENLHTGGLSALEGAFSALGLSDPITVLDFEAAIKNTETK